MKAKLSKLRFQIYFEKNRKSILNVAQNSPLTIKITTLFHRIFTANVIKYNIFRYISKYVVININL